MTFELTDSLKSSLLSALENQGAEFVVNAETGTLEEITDQQAGDFNSKTTNEIQQKYYNIPEWTSEDGFNLRSRFAETVRSPLVHDQLMEVLHSGRGVFRNFKDVLRQYPEVEKIWHKFKNQKMLEEITSWYNSLREIWGLEKLDQIPEPDDTPVYDDFSFKEYDLCYNNIIRQQLGAILDGSNNEMPAEVASAMQKLWQEQFDFDCNEKHLKGVVCHSLSDDFAGCILVKPVCDDRKNVILVTNFFVSERFRGLGIGTELLSVLVSTLQESSDEKWLLMPASITPEIIKPLLISMGFVQNDFGFLLKF